MTDTILVDTSVWVSHLRNGENRLVALLNEENVVCHPFVIGEIACGTMKNRQEILSLLGSLPTVETTSQEEILMFIDSNKLMGRGMGFVDVHLLSSAILHGIPLWTFDKSLVKAANNLSVAFDQ
jgi:predicted nucleic acid-binding protein